jgi:hypothetical protein
MNRSFPLGWDEIDLVRQLVFGLLYQLWMMDDDECGAGETEVPGENLL